MAAPVDWRYIMSGRSHATGGKKWKTTLCVAPGQDAVAVNPTLCVCVISTTGVSTASLSQWVSVCRYGSEKEPHSSPLAQIKKKKSAWFGNSRVLLFFFLARAPMSVENCAWHYGPGRRCLIRKHLTDATLKSVILDKPIERNQKARQQALAPEHTDVI